MKKFLALILAGTMVLSMTGCASTGTAAPAESAAPEGTTATTEHADPTASDYTADIKISWWGGDSRHEATIAVVNAFMAKYPGIKVETEYGAWSGWTDAISTELISGNAADVIQVNWNWITQFSADGSAFADINQYADIIDLTQFKQSALDDCTVAGKLQAVPVAMTTRVLYWNKTTWDKAGLELPKTQADLDAAGPVFAAMGDSYYPFYLGEYDRMIYMVFYLESKYGKPWVENGVVNYTVEEVTDGMNFITGMEENHVIPTIATIAGDGADSVDKNPNWIDGHYAGLWEWDSGFAKEQGALSEGQELVVGDYFTDWGSSKGGYSKVSMGFAIASTSQYPEAGALLINYLLNDPEGVTLAGTERGIPLSVSAQATLGDTMNPQVLDANTKGLAWASFPFDPYFESSELNATGTGIYQDVFGQLSYGNYTAEQAAQTLIDGVNGVMSK